MSVALAHRLDGDPDGPAVVLGPSLGTRWEMWDDLAEVLAPDFRVVRYDTRGHGRSPVPAGPYTVEGLAGDVLALLDSLGVDRFAVVGLSLGGAVGQQLAASHGDRVTAAVLCCTVPQFGEPASWNDRAATVRAEGMAAIADATRGRWFTDELRDRQQDVVEGLIGMLTSTDPEGYAACCEALAGFDSRAWLGSVAVPVRVVAGAGDPVAPPDQCQAMASLIPGAELVVVPDVSHIATVAGAPFHDAVTEHLRSHL